MAWGTTGWLLADAVLWLHMKSVSSLLQSVALAMPKCAWAAWS